MTLFEYLAKIIWRSKTMSEIPMQCKECRFLEQCFALCCLKEKPCRVREATNEVADEIQEEIRKE